MAVPWTEQIWNYHLNWLYLWTEQIWNYHLFWLYLELKKSETIICTDCTFELNKSETIICFGCTLNWTNLKLSFKLTVPLNWTNLTLTFVLTVPLNWTELNKSETIIYIGSTLNWTNMTITFVQAVPWSREIKHYLFLWLYLELNKSDTIISTDWLYDLTVKVMAYIVIFQQSCPSCPTEIIDSTELQSMICEASSGKYYFSPITININTTWSWNQYKHP